MPRWSVKGRLVNRREGPARAPGSYRYYRSQKVWRVKISRIYEETCRILLVAAVIVEDVSPPGEFYLPAGWTVLLTGRRYFTLGASGDSYTYDTRARAYV